MSRQPKKSTTSRPGQDGSGEARARVKTSIHFDPEIHKLLAIASLEMELDMSTIVNRLVKEKFGGWCIRKSRGEVSLPDNSDHDKLERGEDEAPESSAPPRPSRKAPSGGAKSASGREGQNFGLLSERSAHLDHDAAVEEVASKQDKIIDEFVGSEEAA